MALSVLVVVVAGSPGAALCWFGTPGPGVEYRQADRTGRGLARGVRAGTAALQRSDSLPSTPTARTANNASCATRGRGAVCLCPGVNLRPVHRLLSIPVPCSTSPSPGQHCLLRRAGNVTAGYLASK